MSAAVSTIGTVAAAPAGTRLAGRTSRGSARTRPVAVRLTRRGRLLLTVLLLAGLLALAVSLGPQVVATDGAGQPVPVQTVTVQPGQTLWDIAAASGVDADTRAVVAEIQQLNALADAGDLQVGQSLAVPTG